MVNVLEALNAELAKLDHSPLEAEIARALAGSLDSKDNGQGKASTAKELRALLAELQERSEARKVDSPLDDLAKKRAARRTG